VLRKALQIGTLKELYLLFHFSDSLFSYSFSSIGSIGKNLIHVTGLGS
jgi:hypothetical protein